MRRKIVAGNWKMNTSYEEALSLYNAICGGAKPTDVDVLVFPPSVYLHAMSLLKMDIPVGAQNAHQEINGAFTGEISREMLQSISVNWLLIGHSERRQYFNESNEIVHQKLKEALLQGFNCILCVGESLLERKSGAYLEVILQQLEVALEGITDLSLVTIAYEPVWAIGTGETASPEQAQEVHKFIRDYLNKNFSQNTSILYGGSCKPENAKDLFSKPDIDGGLIGGASLKADSFLEIVRSF